MFRSILALCCAMMLAGCVSAPEQPETPAVDSPPWTAEIRWTSHGIPHIRAIDYRGAGYGLAYAVATNTICVLAEEFVTVRGERARYFDGSDDNINADVFHRALLNDDKVRTHMAALGGDTRAMMDGYVAGYNRYISDQQGSLPSACAHEPWIKPITIEDLIKLSTGVGIRYGLGRHHAGIANAAPGYEGASRPAADPANEPGSNALAFGRALTASGRGILMGNPHYPWHGGSRFHLAHITIPGETDVMGAGLITTPQIAIGFNRNVAWTHTVSTALRSTFFRLDLVPGDPLAYRVGAEVMPIVRVPVKVEAKRDRGNIDVVERGVYMTHLGPVVTTSDTPWDREYVYVLRDVNYENYRGGNQYHDLVRARNVADVEAALARHQGVSFVNTIAADRDGNAFYADMSSIPYVTAPQIERCRVTPERIGGRRAIVLNGSVPDCDWQSSPEAAAPGLLPPTAQPKLTTDAFVSNSNDSHWLSSPTERLEGYSPIVGDEQTARSLRTRAGLVFVDELLSRTSSVTPADVQGLLFSHRHFGAELLLDDILMVCESESKTLDLAAACGILAEWDRRQDVDSVGAQVYNELWEAIEDDIDDHFAVPFDQGDPVNTPRGLTVDDAATRKLVMDGLTTALSRLARAGVVPMQPWGDVQFAERGGQKIGVPGGSGAAGMYSVITARLNDEKGGYTPIRHGNSYVQVVTWNEDGTPEARALLTYSQSPHPDSPWYADQTRLYERSEWIDLPFTDAEIEADLVQRLRLTEGRP